MRLDVTLGVVREVGGRSALAVKSYVSIIQERCEKYHPAVSIDDPCTATNVQGNKWVVSLPEPNLDIVKCAFHSVPAEEPVSRKSAESKFLDP